MPSPTFVRRTSSFSPWYSRSRRRTRSDGGSLRRGREIHAAVVVGDQAVDRCTPSRRSGGRPAAGSACWRGSAAAPGARPSGTRAGERRGRSDHSTSEKVATRFLPPAFAWSSASCTFASRNGPEFVAPIRWNPDGVGTLVVESEGVDATSVARRTSRARVADLASLALGNAQRFVDLENS